MDLFLLLTYIIPLPCFLLQASDDISAFVFHLPDHIGDIWPPEACLQYPGILQAESGDDILYHLGCCRCRQGQERHLAADYVTYLGNMEVRWPEVIAPLRYAMCFIDGNKGEVEAGQACPEDRCLQPSRG